MRHFAHILANMLLCERIAATLVHFFISIVVPDTCILYYSWFPLQSSGWLDDGLFIQRDPADKRDGSATGGKRNILWNNFGSHHAFTTGRQRTANETNFGGGKIRPKGPSQTLKVKSSVYSFVK